MKMSIGLSFNGVATVYRGEAAEFGVKVAPSGIGSARAERLAGELSRRLGREVVVGDAELTVYVGKSAQVPFLGLAEGNGQGSAAFVNLDASASDELLLEVAAHEAGHLLGTVRHAGEVEQREVVGRERVARHLGAQRLEDMAEPRTLKAGISGD